MANLTYEEAIEAFEYRDGELFWKPWITVKGRMAAISSKPAGGVSHSGYSRLRFKGKSYYVHRIIFLMHHGYMPDVVDHADHNTTNNRIENLRAADKMTNACNSKIRTDNTSGVKGVTWSKAAQKWQATIHVNKSALYLGLFDNIQAASDAIIAKRHELHGAFARAA